MNKFAVCVVGFAGELFTQYDDNNKEISFDNIEAAKKACDTKFHSDKKHYVVLYRCERVYDSDTGNNFKREYVW